MDKIKFPKDRIELYHYFANNIIPNTVKDIGYITRDDVKWQPDTNVLLLYGSPVCKVFRKEKVVIVRQFFIGRRSEDLILERAFSNDFTVITLHYDYKIPTFDKISEFTEHYIKELITFKIKDNLKTLNTNYHKIKDVINSKRYSYYDSSTYTIKCINENLLKLKKVFKFKLSDIYNSIYTETYYAYVTPSKGWGKGSTDRITIDKPIKFYLNPDKWFNKSEKEELAFKRWKSEYADKLRRINTNITSWGTYKEIYSNKDEKLRFEEHIARRTSNYESEMAKIREKALQKKAIEEVQKVEDWINYKGYGYFSRIYLRLSKCGNLIETSNGANVPIEAGKKAFNIFKRFRYKLEVAVENTSIGLYKYDTVYKIDDNVFIRIGCHTIRDVEIYKFINDFKLDWNDK